MSDLQKIHIVALISHILTIIYFMNWPLLTLLIIFPISLLWFHLGHGVFIHRYFTHRHFKFSNLGILLGHIIYVTTNMGPAIMWAGMHIKHHRTSGTEEDPHEWRKVGLLKAIFSNYGESFSQVDLLCKASDLNKRIINIGSNSPDQDKSIPWPYAIQKAALDKANEQLFYQGTNTTIVRFGYFDSPRVAHIEANKMSIDYCLSVIQWVLNQPHKIKDITRNKVI